MDANPKLLWLSALSFGALYRLQYRSTLHIRVLPFSDNSAGNKVLGGSDDDEDEDVDGDGGSVT